MDSGGQLKVIAEKTAFEATSTVIPLHWEKQNSDCSEAVSSGRRDDPLRTERSDKHTLPVVQETTLWRIANMKERQWSQTENKYLRRQNKPSKQKI